MRKNYHEEELIKKILNGNRQEYKKLVDRYSPMVFHLIRSFISRSDEVEELAQQIFVKAYEKLDSYEKKSKFSTWLYSITRNHCRDYAKNIRRLNIRLGDLEAHTLRNKVSEDELADHIVQTNEKKQLLNDALNHINEDYAKAFIMKYRDNMTYNVMSDRLDTSISALKVRVHRARKELKSFIESNS